MIRICQTCGVESRVGESLPAVCPICRDDRRHREPREQAWTDGKNMRKAGSRNIFTEVETDLFEITTEPVFSDGHRAFLVRTEKGNVLWDCLSYLDESTIAAVKELGGVVAAAFSHPHFYGAVLSWSAVFGQAPIWIAGADRQWAPENCPTVRFYRNDREVLDGVRVVRCGGHFPGSAVLHWSGGAEGKGALLVSDTLNVLANRQRIGFMYSRSDLVPLSAGQVRKMVARLQPLEFDRIYGGWPMENLRADAKEVLLTSADRFVRKSVGRDEGAWKASIL